MKTADAISHGGTAKMQPGRDHWWWRADRLPLALQANPRLGYYFSWKTGRRAGPGATRWTASQRGAIELALWLYELDARVSRKYLFGKPAYLLEPGQLDSVVALTHPMKSVSAGGRRRSFAWAWIEYFDQSHRQNARKPTRLEQEGMIAAMKFCFEYFLHG